MKFSDILQTGGRLGLALCGLCAITRADGASLGPVVNFTSSNLSGSAAYAPSVPTNIGSSDSFNFTIDGSLTASTLSFSYTMGSTTRQDGLAVAAGDTNDNHPLFVELESGINGIYYWGAGTHVSYTLLKEGAQIAQYQANVWEIPNGKGSILLNFELSGQVPLRDSAEAYALDDGLPRNTPTEDLRWLDDFSIFMDEITLFSDRQEGWPSGELYSPLPVLGPGSYELVISRSTAFAGNMGQIGDYMNLVATVTPVPEAGTSAMLLVLGLGAFGLHRSRGKQ